LWDEVGDMAWGPVEEKDRKTVCGGEWHAEKKERGICGEKSGMEQAA